MPRTEIGLSQDGEEGLPTPPPSRRATRATVPRKTQQETAPDAASRSTRVVAQNVGAQSAPEQKVVHTEFKNAKKDDIDVAELEAKMNKIKLQAETKAPPKLKRVHQHEGEYFNALPLLADLEYRSGSQLFVWGAGNAGQFGMGVKHTGEFSKPKKNIVVEKMMRDDKFGKRGILALAAGGMSSLLIDGTGTVRSDMLTICMPLNFANFKVWSCGANDDAALGRPTSKVPHPKDKDAFADEEELSCNLYPLQSLLDEGFEAAQIAAGDSIGAAISVEGELRVWGTFRVGNTLVG